MKRPARVLAAVLAGVSLTACVTAGEADDTATERLTVFGPYRGEDANRFMASLQPFIERTGIDVRYTGSANFVTDLLGRTAPGGDPPDIAMVPQPGLVRQLAKFGALTELSEPTRVALDEHHREASRQLGEIDSLLYGVPFRLNVKSLVWYRPDVFDSNGWTVPDTLDELTALADQIADADAMSPWCLTIQAGSATGWPATDWIEDLVLRRSGPDAYRMWVTGSMKFASDSIRDAFVEFRELVLAPGRLYGGTTYAIDEFTTEIFTGLLADEPGCAMAKQADFASSWLPPATTVGPDGDVDWFVLPGIEAGEAPVVVGGDLAVQFTGSSEAESLMTFLAGPEAGEAWARLGGLISPAVTFDLDNYPNESDRNLAELLTTAAELVFDGSDQMPASVGTNLFWSTITAWVAGALPYESLATGLDEAFEAELGAIQVQLPN